MSYLQPPPNAGPAVNQAATGLQNWKRAGRLVQIGGRLPTANQLRQSFVKIQSKHLAANKLSQPRLPSRPPSLNPSLRRRPTSHSVDFFLSQMDARVGILASMHTHALTASVCAVALRRTSFKPVPVLADNGLLAPAVQSQRPRRPTISPRQTVQVSTSVASTPYPIWNFHLHFSTCYFSAPFFCLELVSCLYPLASCLYPWVFFPHCVCFACTWLGILPHLFFCFSLYVLGHLDPCFPCPSFFRLSLFVLSPCSVSTKSGRFGYQPLIGPTRGS